MADPRATAKQAVGHLTRRNLDALVRNRVTLAILLGSGELVLVLAAMVRSGAFDPAHLDPGRNDDHLLDLVRPCFLATYGAAHRHRVRDIPPRTSAVRAGDVGGSRFVPMLIDRRAAGNPFIATGHLPPSLHLGASGPDLNNVLTAHHHPSIRRT